jgi:enoyl-CoA hydratase
VSEVAVRVERGIQVVRIQNPPVNALSKAVLDGVEAALAACEHEPSVRGLVITGTSDVFAAGADLPSFLREGLLPEQAIRRGVLLMQKIEAFPKPVVAAVQGFCLGGGLEMILAADLRVAAPTARFGQPEVHLGIIPGWNGTVRLPRLIGQSRAQEIILTGAPVDGRRAYEIGLVNRLAEEGLVVDTAVNLAIEVAQQSPQAVAEAKALLRHWAEPGAEERERQAMLRLMRAGDAMEGLTAFMEKRRPRFTRAQ